MKLLFAFVSLTSLSVAVACGDDESSTSGSSSGGTGGTGGAVGGTGGTASGGTSASGGTTSGGAGGTTPTAGTGGATGGAGAGGTAGSAGAGGAMDASAGGMDGGSDDGSVGDGSVGDASVGDGAPGEGGPNQAACDARFSGLNGYVFCSATDTECTFEAQTATSTCATVCGGLGQTCSSAVDDTTGSACTPMGAVSTNCDYPYNRQICTCTHSATDAGDGG